MSVEMWPQEGNDGRWRVCIAFPGNVSMLKVEDGALPEDGLRVWPDFDSKKNTQAFIEELKREVEQ